MRNSSYRRLLIVSTLILNVALAFLPFGAQTAYSARTASQEPDGQLRYEYPVSSQDFAGGFVLEAGQEGAANCRPASQDEARALIRAAESAGLKTITPVRSRRLSPADGGLQITLMGTQQLDSFPDAKAAFLKAAANWEAVLTTPISIVLNVDFGPSAFGTAFPTTVIGSTATQVVSSNTIYPLVRTSLVSEAAGTSSATLISSLPTATIPTDLGTTATIAAPTANFRALGVLPATADPAGEMAQLGGPPAIGFNSAFSFTFDPSGGIMAGTIDFDAVATHEIGHALGFHSEVGSLEIPPAPPLSVSVLDFFRFRPGTMPSAFGLASRVQTSGGDQVFFRGGPEVAFSTGRPNGTGGDGNQASHWKSRLLNGGVLLGIMDPSIAMGERRTIMPNDVTALNAIGYAATIPNPNDVALTSGVSANGVISGPPPNNCFLGGQQYMIQVPAGATQLTIDVTGNQPSTEMLVRFGQEVAIAGGQPVDDYATPTAKQNQEIVVTAASTPPLKTGSYFIAVANCAPGQLAFSITATVTGGSAPPPPPPPAQPPAITSLSADLQGNDLVLTGTATNPGGDTTAAEITIFDASGALVFDSHSFQNAFGAATSFNFTLTMHGLNLEPTGVTAGLVLFNSQAVGSPVVKADFSHGDANGPVLKSGSFDPVGGVLVLKGSGFADTTELEANGVVVNAKAKVKSGGVKVKVGGSASDLNLQSGANRARLVVNGVRSNTIVVTD